MFIVPTLEEIRSSLLRDYQTYYPNSDTSEDSDAYARASSLAACAEGIYAHQKWLIK
ncbi:MAG: baseplate J protein, partial [Rodentibacter sp.]